MGWNLFNWNRWDGNSSSESVNAADGKWGDNEIFYMLAGNDTVYANAGNDIIYGDAGDDILDGGSGNDIMYGGTGNDRFYVDSAGDAVVEYANEGNDSVISTFSYTLGANVEWLSLSGTANINGTGNELNNTIIGTSGSNILNGGAGNDVMMGGAGNDVYYVDSAGDSVYENVNCGNDTIISTISYSLSSNSEVENLVLSGTANINATGNNLNNSIIGNSGNNVISGGLGIDIMQGGNGDDNYAVNSVGDVVIENANEGNDTVQLYTNSQYEPLEFYADASYTLGNNIENLIIGGESNIDAIGNSENNSIRGNLANNTLNGLAGNDTLDGAEGTNILIGGTGDDFYIVNSSNDTVIENASEGNDTICLYSSENYVASDNVESIIFADNTSTANVNLTGNSENNFIKGTLGNNILTGLAGNDTLDGSGNGDIMYGGQGDDVYYVDNINDVVVENAGEGIDTVYFLTDYTAGDNIENITLKDTGSTTGTRNVTGNDLNNIITMENNAQNFIYSLGGDDVIYSGNKNDVIDGGTGIDVMYGRAGNDHYYVDNVLDVCVESENGGEDTIETTVSYTLGSNFENLFLKGSDSSTITGNSLNNRILNQQDSGDCTIACLGGNDTIRGGRGNDTFIFNRGDGSDLIESDLGGTDTLIFGENINVNDIALFMEGSCDRLVLDYNYGDCLNINNSINSDLLFSTVDRFQLNDGLFMTGLDITLLAQQMTAYATENSIQLTNVADVKANVDLMNMVMGSWHS